MTDLEKIHTWLSTFPGTGELPGMPYEFTIDFVAEDPQKAGLHSNGRQEISRTTYLGGNTLVTKQYNLNFEAVLEKDAVSDDIAKRNAEWVLAFQDWVEEQSMTKPEGYPYLGNVDERSEIIRAQNGMYAQRVSDGAGMYIAPITVRFKKYYKSGGN